MWYNCIIVNSLKISKKTCRDFLKCFPMQPSIQKYRLRIRIIRHVLLKIGHLLWTVIMTTFLWGMQLQPYYIFYKHNDHMFRNVKVNDMWQANTLIFNLSTKYQCSFVLQNIHLIYRSSVCNVLNIFMVGFRHSQHCVTVRERVWAALIEKNATDTSLEMPILT